MKARKKDSNDEWQDIAYVQLKDSYCLTSADQMEFQYDTLSTYNQATDEKHWQDVRERAAIAVSCGLLANSELDAPIDKFVNSAIEYADKLVEQLKKKVI